MKNEVELIFENWIVSGGDIDSMISRFMSLKRQCLEKGFKEILLVNHKDLPANFFLEPPKDVPLHTSFCVLGNK